MTPGRRLPTEELRAKWPWFVVLGIVAMLAGFAALVLTATATIASVLTIGIFIAIVGFTEMALGFRARGWGQALYWEVSGVIYVAAGIFAWLEPVQASAVLTLLIGAGLLATGVVRAVTGFRLHHSKMRGPLILSGAVTAILGLIIVSGWPGNSLFIIGMLLGIELLFSGARLGVLRFPPAIQRLNFSLRMTSHALWFPRVASKRHASKGAVGKHDEMGLRVRRRHSRRVGWSAQPAGRQGRQSRRDGAARAAGPPRLHHHDRSLHPLLRPRATLPRRPRQAR